MPGIADLNPQALADARQQKELEDLAQKFNKLADEMFAMAAKADLNIRQSNIFFTKHLPMMWSAKTDKFYGNQQTKNIL